MHGEMQNKRNVTRLPLELAAWVKTPDESLVFSTTRDVSAQGVFLCLKQPLAIGSEIEFTLILPANLTLCADLKLQCKGKVVRLVCHEQETIGIGATIEEHHWLPLHGADEFTNGTLQ